MNLAMVFYILGLILLCEGGLMLLPAIVSLLYREETVWVFLLTAAICGILGFLLWRRKPKNRVFYIREGCVITALSWIVISIMGALPFMLSGTIQNPIEALFETVSGFTTTGASILSDVESLPRGILFWRSFTHWIGGMGVLVFLLSLLPLAGGSHINLMKAESPGPQVEKLVPKVQSTAKILYGIYFVLTVAEIVLLLLGGMPIFDSVTVSFGTAGTGGFGVRNDSIAGYSSYLQWVITIFMILFGVNFNTYFLILMRKWKRSIGEEVRTYFGIIAVAILLIMFNIRSMSGGWIDALRLAAFQVGSIITTTGFATTDFGLWPSLSKTILVMLMFVGACAGSTGGGIKVSRLILLFKTIRKETRSFLHPSSVSRISMDGKTVSDTVLRSLIAFLGMYVFLFSASLLLISFDGHDVVTNFTAVAATLNNIGPGLELVGPTSNFSIYSHGAQLVLIVDMLAGRLELFPLFLLFNKDTWRKF
jgi:trk system potassium uptake protein TrkH